MTTTTTTTIKEFKKIRKLILSTITDKGAHYERYTSEPSKSIAGVFNYTKALVKYCEDMQTLCRLIVRRSAFFQYYKILDKIVPLYTEAFEAYGIYYKKRDTKGLELWGIK